MVLIQFQTGFAWFLHGFYKTMLKTMLPLNPFTIYALRQAYMVCMVFPETLTRASIYFKKGVYRKKGLRKNHANHV